GNGGPHFLGNHRAHVLDLLRGHVENQFVVHLQYHARAQSLAPDAVVDSDHRHLDHVGTGALDGSVHRDALRLAASLFVGGINVRNQTAPPHQGTNISIPPTGIERFIDESLHAAVSFEIFL